VPGGAANQVSGIGRVAQVPDQGRAIVGGALGEIAQGLRAGGGDNQAPCLGQRHEADDAGKPGH
jgi:hypothetical protein